MIVMAMCKEDHFQVIQGYMFLKFRNDFAAIHPHIYEYCPIYKVCVGIIGRIIYFNDLHNYHIMQISFKACDIGRCQSLCCHNCAVLTKAEVSDLIINVNNEYSLELEPKRFFRK